MLLIESQSFTPLTSGAIPSIHNIEHTYIYHIKLFALALEEAGNNKNHGHKQI
jgi:hypothetical protein